MLRAEVVSFCHRQGWDCNDRGPKELKIKVCPGCQNDKYNLEIDPEKEVYKCWACRDFSGHLSQLYRKYEPSFNYPKSDIQPDRVKQEPEKKYRELEMSWLEPLHHRLMANEHAGLDYLKGRGFKEETISHFKLGLGVTSFTGNDGQKKDLPCLLIPYFRSGKIVMVKYRTFPPNDKHYRRIPNMKNSLFNVESLAGNSEQAIVCEGELDAMSVWQATEGKIPAVSICNGVEVFEEEWHDALLPFKRVKLFLDGDEAGQRAAEGLHKRIGEDRVLVPDYIGFKDANEVLQNLGNEALSDIVAHSRPLPVKDVHSAIEVLGDMEERLLTKGEIEAGYPWFLPELTHSLGVFRPGELSVLSGVPGCGKSTISIQQALFMTKNLGIPTLVACYEMPRFLLLRKTIQCMFELTKHQVDQPTLNRARNEIELLPMYYQAQIKGTPNVDSLIESATKSYQRFGIKFLVVDNLHLLSRWSNDPMREAGKVSGRLKLWAQEYDVSVLLLVHPRKMEDGKMEQMNDLRDSAAISADSDHVTFMRRKLLGPTTDKEAWGVETMPTFAPQTYVYSGKSRDHEGTKATWLYLEGSWSKFRLCSETDFEER